MDIGVNRQREIELHVCCIGSHINNASLDPGISEITDWRKDWQIIDIKLTSAGQVVASQLHCQSIIGDSGDSSRNLEFKREGRVLVHIILQKLIVVAFIGHFEPIKRTVGIKGRDCVLIVDG
jgi:hypothetical protein